MNEREAPEQSAEDAAQLAAILAGMSVLAKRLYRELAEAVETQRTRERAD